MTPIILSSKHLLISGRVQGVYFRHSLQRLANALGAKGWCRNLPDERVEAVIYADEATMEKVIAWCHRGPLQAEVTSVVVQDASPVPVLPERFEVRP